MRRQLMTGRTMLCMALGMTATAVGHVDDPKVNDRVPPYMGPGYRSAGPADGGVPLEFPSDGIQLLAWLPLSEFGGAPSSGNDCWGYVSPSGREYALMGLSNGTGVVEITNPGNPQVIATLPAPNSLWHDVKTYDEYAYVVSEGGAGIQVLDLTDVDNGNVQNVAEITSGGTATHNVAINTDSGRLYRTGGSGNGLLIYDLTANPANPTQIGSWPTRYVHDAQIVTYTSGPWAGKEIAFCCSGFNGGSVDTGLDILDVTNPASIISLGQLIYANGAYSHQAWLSEDKQYLYLNDELDENGVLPTTTYVIDVSDLTTPFVANTFTNGNSAIGHNLYVRDDLIYEANYRSGLRVFDTSADPLNPTEIAYFDTWIPDDNDSFNGLWSVYPLFPSGVIIGSDIEKGLFVWRFGDPQLAFTFPQGLPENVAPNGDTVQIAITELQLNALVPGSPSLNVSDGEGGFTSASLTPVGGDVYVGTIPPSVCGDQVEYYFSAVASDGFTETSPSLAPNNSYAATSAFGVDLGFTDDMETDPGYTIENVALDDGGWERGVPAGDGDRGDPLSDFDGSGQCWLTDNVAGNSDVDGGPTRLITPAISVISFADPYVEYARWFTNDDNDTDSLLVELSSNGGPWIPVELVTGNQLGWEQVTFRVADFVIPNGSIRLRFSATDSPNNSVTEAAVDAIRVLSLDCTATTPADLDNDGDVDFADLLIVIGTWGACPPLPTPCPADLDGSGSVDFADVLQLIANWT